MNGMNASTGKPLSGIEHCKQSVRDILSTPKGSRVMLRAYGSDLFTMVDRPMNQSTKMDMVAATTDALALWEPRIRVTNVSFSVTPGGQVTVDVTGQYKPDGQEITIPGIVVK
jgi:hypothetical protein